MKSRLESVLLCLVLASALGWAQDQPANQTPAPAPAAAPAASNTATMPPPREVSSTVNTGTGLSVEPLYWYTKDDAPVLRGGAADLTGEPGDLNYPTRPSRSIGGRLNIPVSKNGTLRASYFQTKGNGFTTAAENLTLFNQAITKGDELGARYRIEGFKLSYDYLTYFWKRGNAEARVKTLYEVQRISVANEVDDYQVDSSGVLQNIAPGTGTKAVFFPTFGLGLEYTASSHFRLEIRGSAFGLLHRADIVDTEAAAAFRVGHVELLAGGKYLHFKTSPKSDQYNSETLYGPFVSLRYYWKKQ